MGKNKVTQSRPEFDDFPKLTDDARRGLELLNRSYELHGPNESFEGATKELFSDMTKDRSQWEENAEMIRQTLNESVADGIVFQSDGFSWKPRRVTEEWELLIGAVLHLANREPERLKTCKIESCDRLFWDASPNHIREICERPECARERHRKAIAQIRRDQKIRQRKRGK